MVVVLELVIAFLVFVLGVVATAGLFVGLLGCLGVVFHVARCKRCGHLWFSSTTEPPQSCSSCNHPWLLHPLHAFDREEMFQGTGDSATANH